MPSPACLPPAIPLSAIVERLESIAPLALAEQWDNVGLLAGDLDAPIRRLMTCLTISAESVREAIEENVQLIVTHHPLPFKPLQRIVTSEVSGQSLWPLIGRGIAIYSPHTAWDNAAQGINARLAAHLKLSEVRPIREFESPSGSNRHLGIGRIGCLEPARTIAEIAAQLRIQLPANRATTNQAPGRLIDCVAIVCGSGGSFVEAARKSGAKLLITGEATYHQCLEAQSMGLGMLMIGHFDSERFSMDGLAGILKADFPTLDVWASRFERDPFIALD